jgi:hypothetical protein
MQFRHVSAAAGGLIMTLSLVLAPSPAAAQTAVAVSVSPPTIEVTVAPGETFTREFEIRNHGNDFSSFTMAVNNAVPTGEEGAQSFNPVGGLASWTNLSEVEFILGAGESRSLSLDVSVPEDAAAGAHYATIFSIAKPGSISEGSGIGVGQYMGTNLLVNVTGDVREAASIVEFSTEKGSYQQAEEIPFVLRLRNDGNTNVRPSGVIEVFRNGARVTSLEVNPNNAAALPSAVRRFAMTSTKTLPAGKYTARALMSFSGQQLSSEEVSFSVVGSNTLLYLVIALGIGFVVALGFALQPRRMKEKA